MSCIKSNQGEELRETRIIGHSNIVKFSEKDGRAARGAVGLCKSWKRSSQNKGLLFVSKKILLLKGVFMKRFRFVSKLEHPKTFATKNISIKFEVAGEELLILGRFLDYNWDNDFKAAVKLLCETQAKGELDKFSTGTFNNCIKKN